jgi:hypothetical protein
MKFTFAANLQFGITMTKVCRGRFGPLDIATLSGGNQSARFRLSLGLKITRASQSQTIYIAAGRGKMIRGQVLEASAR